MSTAASATRPTRCWRSAWPRSKAAVGAIATASGQAALHLAIATLAGAGSHIVARAPRCTAARTTCCTTRWRASASRPPSSSRATSTAGAPRSGPNTKLLFGETLGNPGLDVLDIPTVGAIAHDARPAAAGRLDLHHALADEALRARRRPGLPLGHQVPVAATAR